MEVLKDLSIDHIISLKCNWINGSGMDCNKLVVYVVYDSNLYFHRNSRGIMKIFCRCSTRELREGDQCLILWMLNTRRARVFTVYLWSLDPLPGKEINSKDTERDALTGPKCLLTDTQNS
jgi:hypothetical protein